MQCDTCRRESPVVLRVVVAKDYDRSLARAMYNCPECYKKKERSKSAQGSGLKAEGKNETSSQPSP